MAFLHFHSFPISMKKRSKLVSAIVVPLLAAVIGVFSVSIPGRGPSPLEAQARIRKLAEESRHAAMQREALSVALGLVQAEIDSRGEDQMTNDPIVIAINGAIGAVAPIRELDSVRAELAKIVTRGVTPKEAWEKARSARAVLQNAAATLKA